MLQIYPVMLEVVRMLRPVIARLERVDPDLARQLRRAAQSMALNTAEGSYSRGRNRAARYHAALGSAGRRANTKGKAEGEGQVRWGSLRPSIVLEAVRVAARGKRRSRDVAGFLLDAERAAAELAAELGAGRWRPGVPRGFVVREPKRRVISALPFRDRVVQHLLVAATVPSLERHFAPQSWACRRGMGTHGCLRAAAGHFRCHGWVLRLDYAKFFHSIDHGIVLELLAPHTPPEWRSITQAILSGPAHLERVDFRFPGDDLFTPLTRPRGLPVGNLTSQVWANLMLTPIDHLLAAHLGLGSFVRYCDDLLVFADDPERLREAWAAARERSDSLRLRLHPTKCRLHRTSEPVAFLGFVLARRGRGVSVRLRCENVRRFRRRIAESRRLLAAGALEPDELLAQLRAWLAHARHGHTRRLVERELARLSDYSDSGG